MENKINVPHETIESSELAKPKTISHYIHAATADNTRKAYQNDIKQFISWGGLLPATADVLAAYLHDNADILNPRTLTRRLTAIKQWHTCQGFSDPTANASVRKTLSGIYHIHGKVEEKAPALSTEQLLLLVSSLQTRGQFADWRDNALLQVGFFGAFRRSELSAMSWEHISFVEQGVEILVPRSKTDQIGKGQVCAIPNGSAQLCAVKALKQWQEISGQNSGAIFRAITKNNTLRSQALAPSSISVIIKQHAIACHLPNAQTYSGHSLRRGFATAASQKGASFGAIMRQGRWKHEGTVHGYVEEGQRFDRNAANAIFNEVKAKDNYDGN